MASFNLDEYSTVQERIFEFYRDFPDGSIKTFLRHREGPEVVFEAQVFRNPGDVGPGVYTCGWAHEVEGKSPVNKTSHVENCESSAIGRALANLGYSKDATRPTRSEMLKVARVRQEHEAMLDFVRSVGAACEEELEVTIAGATRNLKAYVRENWQAMKEQPRMARVVVDAIEASTEHKFQ